MFVTLRRCHIRGMHHYHFRAEEWAEIVGIVFARGRACYYVRFPDGKEDYWPIEDPANGYQFSPGMEWEAETTNDLR